MPVDSTEKAHFTEQIASQQTGVELHDTRRCRAARGELQKQKGGTAALGRKQPPLAVDEQSWRGEGS